MTQKDHFNALAAAVVAAYQKESAAPAALVEKYSALLDQAKATAKAARLAWDTAEEAARKERAALLDKKDPDAFDLVNQMRAKWRDEEEPPLEDAYTQANEALKRATMLANFAAIPFLSLQAVAILKIYAAFFEAFPKAGTLNRNSSRRDMIQGYIKEINPSFFFWGNLKMLGAEVRADPYNYEGQTTKEETAKALESAESRRAACLKSEADILSRVDLIEQAEKQLATFKATYEKSGRALRNLMQGLFTQNETLDKLKNISFY